MSSQSTLAKITRPRLVRVYNRQRLFDRLDHARERPIIWISAPAGAGKTTLVASYIRESNLPCIWYNLDEGDGDIGSFFYYMGLANKNADPGKRKSLPLLTSEYLANLPDFTRRYFRDLFAHIRTPGVLVLDNYEAAPAESHLHEVIRYGLTEVPEGIHVIIVSRVDTPKALVGFRASDGLDMLTWDDLRLTPEESKNICQLHKKKTFSTKALQTLHRQTRGWVAGLVLLLGRNGDHSISEGLKDQGSREPIFDYFAYEVFRSVDKDVQSFLMRTSVLSRITATLAEQLTDAPEAERILRRLTQRNLFTVKLTGSDPTYEYHPLFREFLLNQMGKAFEPQAVTALRIKAAHLLVGAGELEAAAELFRQAGAWDTLAELICEHAADFLAQGRNRTLEKLIRTLPDEMMEEHPWLPYNCYFPDCGTLNFYF